MFDDFEDSCGCIVLYMLESLEITVNDEEVKMTETGRLMAKATINSLHLKT